MTLPTSYLLSAKNLPTILDAIRSAQAPEKFTTRFLESLEFKAAADRLIIGVLKSLGFLDDSGKPKDRYFRYLDQTQSKLVLAEGIRDAYQDLFQINTTANKLAKQDVVNKLKTLSQGQFTENVADKMAMTFVQLCGLADFDSPPQSAPKVSAPDDESTEEDTDATGKKLGVALGGLHYNIQIIMPESRDPKVYDALFRSLKEHLL